MVPVTGNVQSKVVKLNCTLKVHQSFVFGTMGMSQITLICLLFSSIIGWKGRWKLIYRYLLVKFITQLQMTSKVKFNQWTLMMCSLRGSFVPKYHSDRALTVGDVRHVQSCHGTSVKSISHWTSAPKLWTMWMVPLVSSNFMTVIMINLIHSLYLELRNFSKFLHSKMVAQVEKVENWAKMSSAYWPKVAQVEEVENRDRMSFAYWP